MTLIDDDQVEEVGEVLAKGILRARRQRLVDAEVHVAALADVAASYLVARVTERREDLGHGIVDQDVAIGEEQDLSMMRSPLVA